MENKYKKRAEEIFENSFNENEKGLSHYSVYDEKDFIIDLLCKVAEEVEQSVGNKYTNEKVYILNESQIEELLLKQKEICANEATLAIEYEDIEQYSVDIDECCTESTFVSVHTDSILNAPDAKI